MGVLWLMPGRLIRSAGLAVGPGASASLTVREAFPDDASYDGWREVGVVLSSPDAVPLSVWARFPTGPGIEECFFVSFHVGCVGLSTSTQFCIPWGVSSARTGFPWEDIPGRVVQEASEIGHPEEAVHRAASLLAGTVLELVSDAWAASLVRRACSMVPPARVAELAREATVEQVMES